MTKFDWEKGPKRAQNLIEPSDSDLASAVRQIITEQDNTGINVITHVPVFPSVNELNAYKCDIRSRIASLRIPECDLSFSTYGVVGREGTIEKICSIAIRTIRALTASEIARKMYRPPGRKAYRKR